MAQTEPPRFVWTCPECERRVPNQVTQCRCGYVRQQEESAAPKPAAADSAAGPASPARGWLWPALAGALAVTLLVVAGLRWQSGTAPEPPAPAQPIAQALPAEASAPAPAPEAAAATPEPLPVEVPMVPSAAPAVAPASTAPLALEDVIESVLPAVVVVETPRGTGSGFFVNDVSVLTSAHVVADQSLVTLRLGSGETVAARVAAVDRNADLALLRTPEPTVPRRALPLGSAGSTKVGQQVFVVGSPLGTFSNTVTRGIVSALRNLGGVSFIQTDAAINPGNSGGPVMNEAGEVIAVATAKARGGESLGFAVAIDYAEPLLAGRAPTRSTTPAARATDPAPSAPGPPAVATAPPSEAELRRQQGTEAYERNMKTLADGSDKVDAEWNKYASACAKPGRAAGSPDRPWFPLLTDSTSVANDVDQMCRALVDNLRTYVQQIADGMRQSNDWARRAGVYPGVQRQIRRKYRMGWDGWDR